MTPPDAANDAKQKLDDMPAALPAMWRALKRAHEAEPKLLAFSFSLSMLSALPDALLALWMKLLADGVTGQRSGLITAAALGLAFSAVGTWFLKVTSDRAQRRFRDRVAIALESHVAGLQASVAAIAHHERPELLDRLAMLRDQVFVLDHMYMSLFSTCGWLLRLGVTVALLMSVHPVLALLAVFAMPTVFTSTWRPGVERAAQEGAAPDNRLARHLFMTATTASPAKEVRTTGISAALQDRRRTVWERAYAPVARARSVSALWHMAGWALFGAAYVGAVAWTASHTGATPGQVLLVLAAGARLSAYIGATVGEIGFLRGFWLDGSRRMAWLEDYARAEAESAAESVPERLTQGIRFDGVSFCYPGTQRRVLEDIQLDLKPGSVVAIVGENGAGKSTLVKLLCRLYRPTEGRILADGVDLARMPPEKWRERIAGAFQDFFRFEFSAKYSVSLGDLPRLDDAAAARAAVARAGAEDVIEKLPAGLETQLGSTWPQGAEMSFGQWQKIALARGFMREEPLVLVLDEPTAALDAETEHALFERYAAAARDRNRITILVSHRFSTVRMADQIVVLDGAKLVETGSHEALMKKGGTYAELYRIQAAAYK
jgi:ATP-binding cassette subfamily B protein